MNQYNTIVTGIEVSQFDTTMFSPNEWHQVQGTGYLYVEYTHFLKNPIESMFFFAELSKVNYKGYNNNTFTSVGQRVECVVQKIAPNYVKVAMIDYGA